MAFKFEDLRVWQAAIEFTDDIYLLTEKFPKEKCLDYPHKLKGQQILFR
jgi:hypothetical protein